jgi:uncharacterized protein (DUF4415 family)
MKVMAKNPSGSSQRGRPQSVKEKTITVKPATKLTKAQRRELETLARKPESEIDTSDIPEIKDWSHGFRFARRPRQANVHIEADILEWLQSQDKDVGKALNRILRLVMDLTRQLRRRRPAA